MKRIGSLCIVSLLVTGLTYESVLARGGRGGGAGAARGGSMAGASRGGSMAGASRGGGASIASNRSPSMSHLPSTRPATATGAVSRPSGQALSRGTSELTRPAVASRPAATSRPTSNQVGNFLNLPANDRTSSFNAGGGISQRPSQLPASDGPRTIETAGGGTITVGGRGGSTEVGGVTVGGGVGGIRVETAGGNTFGKVAGGVGVTDGSNGAIRTGSISGGKGDAGSFVNVNRRYADTAGNRASGSVTAARGSNGYTAVNVRGATSQGITGQVGSVTAVRGPGGNVVAAGRGASFVNGQFVGGQSWTAVNGAYTRWNYYTPGWAARYPGAWWPGKWAVVGTAWTIATWPYASAYCVTSGEPIYYDYGTNVYYEEGNVFVDDQQVGTAEEYYQEAEQIAEAGTEIENEEWLPLGVFAVIAEEGQTHTDKVVQLAMNREGVIRGNFQDMLTDKVTPVVGAVDKETQRVSMKLEGNDSLIVETGLYNLTNDEVPVLVHLGPEQQEGRVLIRLQQPEDEAGQQEVGQGN